MSALTGFHMVRDSRASLRRPRPKGKGGWQSDALRRTRRIGVMLLDATHLARSHALLRAEREVCERLGPIMAGGHPVAWTTWQLCENATEASEASLSLLANDKIWICEMLIRSIAEGSLKVLFLLTGTAQESVEKAEEFMIDLSNLAKLRQHNLLAAAMAVARPDAVPWMRKDMLEPDEAARIERKHSRSERQKLIKRWSFASIADTLANHHPAFANLRHLAYSYSHGSQFLHQDSPALLQRWARVVMPPAKRLATDRAHAVRQLTDLIALVELRLAAVASAFELAVDDVQDAAGCLAAELRAACLAHLHAADEVPPLV